MTYQIAAIPMTLSDRDLQGHSPTASLFRTAVQQLTRFQLT